MIAQSGKATLRFVAIGAVAKSRFAGLFPCRGVVDFVPVRNTHEFDPAFAAMLREHADALLMTNDPFHQRHIQKILAFLA
jgi:hypothetical protein